jgi:hypothetical protein
VDIHFLYGAQRFARSLDCGKGLGHEFQMGGGAQDAARSNEKRIVGDPNACTTAWAIYHLKGVDQTHRPPVG